MFYLDTSALAKLVLVEGESAALDSFLVGRSHLATSALTRTELARAAMQREATDGEMVARVLSGIALVPVSDAILETAGRLAPPSLRSLDAIHLASALLIREELEAFVAYDARLLEAAAALGLPVASPGAPISH